MEIAAETEVPANLYFMNPPELHFPYDVPFQTLDGFNGPTQGTWFFHSWNQGEIYGPYMTEEDCWETLSYVKQHG